MAQINQGTLTRTNKLIFGDETDNGKHPVFTLHNWKAGHHHYLAKNADNKIHPREHNRAKLLFIKAQESTFNFLFRWLALEESERQERGLEKKRRLSRAPHITLGKLNKGREEEDVEEAVIESSKVRKNSLLANVSKLPDRRLSNIIKFFFWRWLTWANACEFILVIGLIFCCVYQCYELLEDYYNYPTHVSITKILNDNFKEDLPAITLCNNNRMSKEALKLYFPEYNLTHFIAMTFGTFHSLNNFTLPEKGHKYSSIDDQLEDKSVRPTTLSEADIDWLLVATYLSRREIGASYKFKPLHDLVDTVTCANIWGDQMPCQNFKRISSLQQHAACVTLFHDSTFWDKSDFAVQELETALKATPSSTRILSDRNSPSENDADTEIIDLKESDLNPESGKSDDDPLKLKLEMSNMEVLRLRINFQVDDYANLRAIVGARIAVHAKSEIASINHINYHVEPGLWYSYYLERFDYRRLPAPYETNCYDYQQNRNDWIAKMTRDDANKNEIYELIRRQARSPDKLIPEYVNSLRQRSLGSRECKNICGAELPATKCGCWNKDIPYLRDNHVDVNETYVWCSPEILTKVANGTQIAGDDLFFQLCVKEFFLNCMEACPDECNFSSFDITQQSRSWPSHESRRYITDQRLLTRLKVEGECCATISVLYASPSSSLHITEQKYTRQDMVTIISGNIEAWIGLSAAHAYLFLEKFYDALLEAGLISSSSSSNETPRGSNINGNNGNSQSTATRRGGRFRSSQTTNHSGGSGGWFSFLISIFTTLKIKVSQLFTYLFHRLVGRLFWSKTNKRVIGQSAGGRAAVAKSTRAAPKASIGAEPENSEK